MTSHSHPETCRRARPLLGTIVEIAATGPHAPVAVDAAFAIMMKTHHLMSFHEEGSDVSRINAARIGACVIVDPDTHRVLTFARKLSEASRGAFDVTVGGALVQRGFLPPKASASIEFSQGTWRDLDLLPGDGVRWRRKSCIDLGGIAKGYAVDLGIAALRSAGARSAVVNAGGDLRMFGEPQPVHVRLPWAPQSLAPLGAFADCAVATSAAYFSSRPAADGPVEPLVDRAHGLRAAGADSVTVIAEDCMTADALTKVVRLESRWAAQVLSQFAATAVVIDHLGWRVLNAYQRTKDS
jgi:thiamine biosynthesis lipoprotein